MIPIDNFTFMWYTLSKQITFNKLSQEHKMKKITAVALIICILFAICSCKSSTDTEISEDDALNLAKEKISSEGSLFAKFSIEEKIVSGVNMTDYSSKYSVDGFKIHESVGQSIDVTKPVTVTGEVTYVNDEELEGQTGSADIEIDENGYGSVTFTYTCNHSGGTTEIEATVKIEPHLEYYKKLAKQNAEAK